MEKQLSILGCGWLGLPLSKHLLQKDWKIKGSTTSLAKLNTLEKLGVLPYHVLLEEDQIEGDVDGFLEGSEILIINIPPGLRQRPKSNFVAKLRRLSGVISKSSIKNILYVSSTGVFQDHESLPTFTEHYKFTSKEAEQSQLIQAENLLLNLDHIQSGVIRFGGLIGKDRHPVNYLSGKTNLKNPYAPVNLIHLDNCIKLISEIIRQEKFGMTFHGVEDVKKCKKDYYLSKAKAYNLPAPEFDYDTHSEGKNISMEWTKKELGIILKMKV